jgi:hypothetical protein
MFTGNQLFTYDHIVAFTKKAIPFAELLGEYTLMTVDFNVKLPKGKILLVKDRVGEGKTTEKAIKFIQTTNEVVGVFALKGRNITLSVPYYYLIADNVGQDRLPLIPHQ